MSNETEDIVYVAQPSTKVKVRWYILHGSLAFLNAAILLIIWPRLTLIDRLWFVGVTVLVVVTVVPRVAPQVVFSRKEVRRRGILGKISCFRYGEINRVKNSWLPGLVIEFRNRQGFHIPQWWQHDREGIIDLIRRMNPKCRIEGDGAYKDPNRPTTLDL